MTALASIVTLTALEVHCTGDRSDGQGAVGVQHSLPFKLEPKVEEPSLNVTDPT